MLLGNADFASRTNALKYLAVLKINRVNKGGPTPLVSDILGSDGTNSDYGSFALYPHVLTSTYSYSFGPRHNGSSAGNMVYVDGRAKTVSYEKLRKDALEARDRFVTLYGTIGGWESGGGYLAGY
jgi:prepilin-type processing-associated H-X9-DG protein